MADSAKPKKSLASFKSKPVKPAAKPPRPKGAAAAAAASLFKGKW